MLVATLQIKQIPDELHRELRARAASSRKTLRDYVLSLLEREVSLPTVEDWLGEVRQNDTVADGPPSAELVKAAREE